MAGWGRSMAVAGALMLSGTAGAPLASQNAPATGAAEEYSAGRARYARDDLAGARAAFERAVALAPNVADYHYWLGRTLGMQAVHASIFSRLSLGRRAKAEFERAVALDPRGWEGRRALEEYYLRAPGIAGGSKEEALAQARVLQRLYPYRGRVQVARVLLAMGRREQATAELRALAAAYPDSARPEVQLAELRRSLSRR